MLSTRIAGLMPSRADLRASWAPILRGAAIGAFFGILPGAGQTISSFANYTVEKDEPRSVALRRRRH